MVSRMRKIGKYVLLFLCLFLHQLSIATVVKPALDSYIQPVVMSTTMVMIHDVVNPPAAARFYSYMLLSAQVIVSQEGEEIPSPAVLLKNFPKISISKGPNAQIKLAALYSILESGRLLLPSGFQLEADQKKLVVKWKKAGFSAKEIQESIELATQVSNQIVAWAKTDGYFTLSTLRRYRPLKDRGFWYPTPPAYMEAVEPHWSTIKPMFLDSASQFKPHPPVTYHEDPSSEFYQLAKDVFEIKNKLSPEQKLIAAFWDCNPFAINTSGHMSIGFKKMSPGGHWMNIAGIACRKKQLSFEKTIFLHALVATTLMDAFISCWDEKFRSNRIRPETVIQRLFDIHWQPLLQTPPFPEYTSGHSVISTAAAEILTHFLGDSFSYMDDSEIYFDLKPRSFSSFRQAANEAAISRLYGGIHYLDAIEQGQVQGRNIGNFIIEKIKTAQIKTF
ncbi:vanadium-dependent haloperoxidase [Aquirufa ecclesiirivi]